MSAEWIVFVNGQIQDTAGQGLANGKAQVCLRLDGGLLLCLRPEDTNAEGFFSIEVPENARCIVEVTMRALVPSTPRSTTYCNIPLTPGANTLEVPFPLVLHDLTPVANLPPVGDMNMSRTVTFDDGLEINFTPFDFYADYAELAAAKIDTSMSQGLCFLQGQPAVEALYAFSPEGTVEINPAMNKGPFSVRIPNSTNIPAGTQVKLFQLGGIGCKTPGGEEIKEAEWHEIGTGTVNMSGTHIESDPGSGLTCTTWLGVSR